MHELPIRLNALLVRSLPWLRVMRWWPADALLLPIVPVVAALLLNNSGPISLWRAAASVALALLWWSASWSWLALLERGHGAAEWTASARRSTQRVTSIAVVLALGCALLLGAKATAMLAILLLVSALYPWLRRHSFVADGVLGVGVAALVALTNAGLGRWPDQTALLLATALLPWVVAWRVLETWSQRDADTRRGIRTLASMFGAASGVVIGGLQLFALVGWWLVATQAQLQHAFTFGWWTAAVLVVVQYLFMARAGDNKLRYAVWLHQLTGTVLLLSLFVALHGA